MKVINYEETVVWEDPLIVLIEETLEHDDEIEGSTFTVYSGGQRLFTAITEEAAWIGIYDIIDKLENDEEYA
jgi:hypothetical protein